MKCRRQKTNQAKDPNEPVKPPKPYIRYSRSVWEKVSSENPGMNIGQIGNTVGRMWRTLSDDDKEVFNQEHREDMIRYENEIRLYYKSPNYAEWLKKNEENNQVKPKESPKKQLVNLEKIVMGKEVFSENSYIQEELDSDEEIDFMDIKMESSYRFYRNHSLMHELYSDLRVPVVNEAAHEPSHMEIESEIEQVQSQLAQMKNHHFDRIARMTQRNLDFEKLMRLENEKLKNLIDAPKLCD